jgi:hypothetical protein
MTKEEYEKLLQSDYWKGFSYSLIKERNFTCEDCGRRFYNQRNKLQVHHLVYKDINPWSYKPEEMVVLCEECHKKRHGLWQEPIQEANTTHSQNAFGDYTKSYSYSTESREERLHSYSEADRWGNANDRTIANGNNSRNSYPVESKNRFRWKYVLYGILFLFVLSFAWNRLSQNPTDNSEDIEEPVSQSVTVEQGRFDSSSDKEVKAQKEVSSNHNRNVTEQDVSNSNIVNDLSESSTQLVESTVPSNTPSNETPRDEIVPSKESAAPQRELSTIEILERKNHADVVKRAKRAGVSTEGSTIEILERINHADVVKRAKRLGVSTEGSTIDILERINRKELEKYNY